MPFGSSNSFLHSDTIVFGTASTPGVLWRNATTGKLQILDLGLAQAGKLLGVSSSGLLELQTPATFSLADGSVTNAKLANMATATIKGRVSAGSGVAEDLTQAQMRTFLGYGTAALLNSGTAAGDIPLLTTGGVLPASMIPSVAIGNYQTVATNAAKLALTGLSPGESIVIVTADETRGGKRSTYAYVSGTISLEASWINLSDEQVDAGDIVSGTIAAARLGSGTANASTYLRGDGSWQAIAGKDPLSVVTANGALTANSRVYANGASRLSLSLPTTASQGSQIDLTDISTNGWRVTQATGQQIFFPDGSSSASGTGGYIESPLGDNVTTPRSRYCNVMLECIGANNTWLVKNQNSIVTYV